MQYTCSDALAEERVVSLAVLSFLQDYLSIDYSTVVFIHINILFVVKWFGVSRDYSSRIGDQFHIYVIIYH